MEPFPYKIPGSEGFRPLCLTSSFLQRKVSSTHGYTLLMFYWLLASSLLLLSMASLTLAFPLEMNNVLLGVMNGEYVKDNEWPMVASIQFNAEDGWRHFCGSTVWNANWILTAAHCMFNQTTQFKKKQLSVYVGHTDISDDDDDYRFKVVQMIKHKNYNPKEGTKAGYDIAMFQLDRPIDFKNKNKKVRCACWRKATTKQPDRLQCFVVGWGADGENSDNARFNWNQEVKVPLREWSYCKKSLKGTSRGLICAGYNEGTKDSCQGDSGGPLFCALSKKPPFEYIQVGIVSYGVGCGRANSPGFYSSVRYYRDWIKVRV